MVTHWHVREPRSGECTMPTAASPCLNRNGHGFETTNRERLHSPHVRADRPCLQDSRLLFTLLSLAPASAESINAPVQARWANAQRASLRLPTNPLRLAGRVHIRL